MRKRCILNLIIIIQCLLISCKNSFLEVIDKTVLLKQGYVKDLNSTEEYLNGIYVNMATKYVDGLTFPYSEIIADNIKPFGSMIPVSVYKWEQQVNSPADNLNTQWYNYYGMIRDCNFVIERADKYHDEDSDKADNLKGQALAIRAMLHFSLVNMFAQPYSFTAEGSHEGIPYIKSSDIESQPRTRDNVAQVYSMIIEDLKSTLQLLSRHDLKRERMNYLSASALLARVYIFKGEYKLAKDISLLVLMDQPIMTVGYPQNLYTKDDPESLFRIPPGASGTDNYYAIFMGYYASPNGLLSYVATGDIAELLTANLNDKRSMWVNKTPDGWIITKFPEAATGLFPLPNGDHYQTLFRSSEMSLIASEAYFNLHQEDSARFFLDAIRRRANPMLTAISASGDALKDSIFIERRKELAFEGLRMFDLLRWKRGVKRLDSDDVTARELTYPNDKAIAPLPKQDVDLSGLKQNPSY